MKLYLTVFAMLLSLAGMSHAEDLDRPSESGKSGTIFHEWMQAPPPAPHPGSGGAYRLLPPAPMEIQLLSGPSILPLGVMLLGLFAGRLVARES